MTRFWKVAKLATLQRLWEKILANWGCMKNYSRLELFYARRKRLQKCAYLGEMKRFEKWQK